jgi:flagellar hook-length control protein FliK
MIIATSNAQPVTTTTRADASGAPMRAGAPSTPDSVDPTQAPDGDTAQGFGQILAQRLNGGGIDGVAKGDGLPVDAKPQAAPDGLPLDAKIPVGPDGLPLATIKAAPARDAIDPDANATIGGAAAAPGVVAKATTTRPTDDAPAVPDRKEGDDAAGNDLAAQIALVSQWAALPPASSAKAGTDAPADGHDIKGKRDTIRVATSKTAGADAASALAPGALEQTQAAAIPLVASTAQQSLDRTLRAAVTSTAAVTKGADLKAQDDAKAAAVGDRLSVAEALLGKIDAAGARGPSDTTTFANALVTQAASQAANAQPAAADPTTAQLRETVGTPAWSHEVGQATLRLAASDLQGASLRLNPEHLGPLDVQVRVDNGVAHLSFNAAHADTRAAIESSRTTLDQLFADQGLKIGDCAVGDSSAQRRFDAQGTSQGDARRDDGARGMKDDSSGDATSATVTVRRALGLVDTFA